jgi:hypothetical protein
MPDLIESDLDYYDGYEAGKEAKRAEIERLCRNIIAELRAENERLRAEIVRLCIGSRSNE